MDANDRSIQLAKEYWVWSDALKPLLTELLGPPAHAAPIGGLSPDDSLLEMSAPLGKCHPRGRLLPASLRAVSETLRRDDAGGLRASSPPERFRYSSKTSRD